MITTKKKPQKNCLLCEHFTLEAIANGYHGTCDEKEEFVRCSDKCDFFKRRKNVGAKHD